jgi:hypothetical protein
LAKPRVVRRQVGELTVGFRLQGSSNSRTGELTVAYVTVTVDDERLGQWRRDHPRLSHRDDAQLFASMLVNLAPHASIIELYGRLHEVAPGVVLLADVPDLLRDEVLSVLPAFDSPDEALRTLPDRWLHEANSLVEWAVSRGAMDVAKRLILRYLTLHPMRVENFEQGLMSGGAEVREAVWMPDTALGRSAVALGLFAADERVPIAPSRPRRRTLMQRLRGDR